MCEMGIDLTYAYAPPPALPLSAPGPGLQAQPPAALIGALPATLREKIGPLEKKERENSHVVDYEGIHVVCVIGMVFCGVNSMGLLVEKRRP